MTIAPWVKPVAVAAALIGGGLVGYYTVYARPLSKVSKDLDALVASNNDITSAIKDRTRVKEQLKGFGQRVLSASAEDADAKLRSLLSRIAEDGGLAKSSLQISTKKPEHQINPAGTSKLTTRLKDDLKKQVDFYVIRGDLVGIGSLESTLRVMASLRAQPWVHRIESFSLTPEDRDRQKFTLRISVATLLFPDLTPKDLPEPTITPVQEGGKQLWAGIVQKNVFKEPAPIVVAAAPQPPPDAPPPTPAPPPAYNDWKLTGITEGRSGMSAMLVNVKNKQSVILQAGAAVADARFVTGQGEKAVFEIAGEKFEVFNGQTLEQRRPVGR
jgi:hypothetical protein